MGAAFKEDVLLYQLFQLNHYPILRIKKISIGHTPTIIASHNI